MRRRVRGKRAHGHMLEAPGRDARFEQLVPTGDVATGTDGLVAEGRGVLVGSQAARTRRAGAGHPWWGRAEERESGRPVAELMATRARVAPRRGEMQRAGVAADKDVGEI